MRALDGVFSMSPGRLAVVRSLLAGHGNCNFCENVLCLLEKNSVLQEEKAHSDQQLLQAIAGGSEAAFSRLFYGYHQRVGAYVFRLTGSLVLAEEVTQEVFLKIWLRRELLADVRNFSAYLFVLAKNQALNRIRGQVRERENRMKVCRDPTSFVGLAERASGEESDNPYERMVDAAVQALPPQQQKVYLLRRHRGLKYEEIARQMRISRETVKKYLQLARRSIVGYAQDHRDLFFVVLAALFGGNGG